MSENCLFCKIAGGDVPSTEVASDELTYAFRDLSPQAPTHVLVIPRQHITDAHQVRPEHGEVVAAMFSMAQQVAQIEGIEPGEDGENGYRLVMNVGKDALNSVPHLHLHVLGGRKLTWPPG